MSQTEKLRRLLSDGQPHRTDKIVEYVYGPGLSLSRVAARIHDLRKRLPPGKDIIGWRDKDNPALYWYRIMDVADAPATVANPPVTTDACGDGELFTRRFGVRE